MTISKIYTSPPSHRAGLTLFMTSAYILFLNPLILSGNSGGAYTGMPSEDVALATAISTGFATLIMGVWANYPVRAPSSSAYTPNPFVDAVGSTLTAMWPSPVGG